MYLRDSVEPGEKVQLRTNVKVYFEDHPTIRMIEFRQHAVVEVTEQDSEGRIYWEGPEGSTCWCWKNMANYISDLDKLALVNMGEE